MWRRSQVVRQRSAKPLFIGSIPIAASTLTLQPSTVTVRLFSLSLAAGNLPVVRKVGEFTDKIGAGVSPPNFSTPGEKAGEPLPWLPDPNRNQQTNPQGSTLQILLRPRDIPNIKAGRPALYQVLLCKLRRTITLLMSRSRLLTLTNLGIISAGKLGICVRLVQQY